MSRIYWDTMIFVYWLENHPEYFGRVHEIYSRMRERGDVLCTSTFTVGEVLVLPQRKGNQSRFRQTYEFFRSAALELIPFGIDTALRYAQIRATMPVSAADAVHLACAATVGTELFLTNDQWLARRIVPGIHFIVTLESAPI